MQRTRVQSLAWEGSPRCRVTKPGNHSYWACALEPALSNVEAPARWWRVDPALAATTKSLPQQRSLHSHEYVNKWILTTSLGNWNTTDNRKGHVSWALNEIHVFWGDSPIKVKADRTSNGVSGYINQISKKTGNAEREKEKPFLPFQCAPLQKQRGILTFGKCCVNYLGGIWKPSQVAQWYRIGLYCRRHKRLGFDSWLGKIPWRRKWQPTLVFFPGESHGQREPDGLQSIGSQRVWWAHMHAEGTLIVPECLSWVIFYI